MACQYPDAEAFFAERRWHPAKEGAMMKDELEPVGVPEEGMVVVFLRDRRSWFVWDVSRSSDERRAGWR
jgi:hypothetical protein